MHRIKKRAQEPDKTPISLVFISSPFGKETKRDFIVHLEKFLSEAFLRWFILSGLNIKCKQIVSLAGYIQNLYLSEKERSQQQRWQLVWISYCAREVVHCLWCCEVLASSGRIDAVLPIHH